MKKTIISVAVAMASMSAFAASEVATTSVSQSAIENLEVFGKVGVSYDSYEAGQTDVSEINYLRNTEIGASTSAMVGHGLKATATVVGNFNNDDQHFGLDKVELGLEHEMGAVHFGKIDDRYDQVTGKFDAFSEVFGGDALGGVLEGYSATGKVEGLAISATPVAGLELALQLGDAEVGEIGDDLALTAAYTVAGLDLSGAYRNKDVAGVDTTAYKFGAGYGMNNLYAGLVYEVEEIGAVDSTTLSLSGSYKLDALTLKAGYGMGETELAGVTADTDVIRLAAQYDVRENVALNLGYAIADSDAPELDGDMVTAGMIVRF